MNSHGPVAFEHHGGHVLGRYRLSIPVVRISAVIADLSPRPHVCAKAINRHITTYARAVCFYAGNVSFQHEEVSSC